MCSVKQRQLRKSIKDTGLIQTPQIDTGLYQIPQLKEALLIFLFWCLITYLFSILEAISKLKTSSLLL